MEQATMKLEKQAELSKWLANNYKKYGYCEPSYEKLLHWVIDAEDQIEAGQDVAVIEIPARSSNSGHAETFNIGKKFFSISDPEWQDILTEASFQ